MKHLITERHEVLVSCDASQDGRHKLTVLRGGDVERPEIVFVAAECGKDGDAAARLGAISCAAVAENIRACVRGSGRVLGQPKGNRHELPVGIHDIVSGSETYGDAKRRDRKRPAIDARAPLVRLLEARVNRVTADAGILEHLTVEIDSAGTRHVLNTGSYQSVRNVAHKHPGGAWRLDDNIAFAAKYLGTVNQRCTVCPKHAETVWKDVDQHARGGDHIKNVCKILRAVFDELPPQDWRRA